MSVNDIITKLETERQDAYDAINKKIDQKTERAMMKELKKQAEALKERGIASTRTLEKLAIIERVETGHQQDIEAYHYYTSEEYVQTLQHAPDKVKEAAAAHMQELVRRIGKKYFSAKQDIETVQPLDLDLVTVVSDSQVAVLLPVYKGSHTKEGRSEADLFNYTVKAVAKSLKVMEIKTRAQETVYGEDLVAVSIPVENRKIARELGIAIVDDLRSSHPKTFAQAKIGLHMALYFTHEKLTQESTIDDTVQDAPEQSELDTRYDGYKGLREQGVDHATIMEQFKAAGINGRVVHGYRQGFEKVLRKTTSGKRTREKSIGSSTYATLRESGKTHEEAYKNLHAKGIDGRAIHCWHLAYEKKAHKSPRETADSGMSATDKYLVEKREVLRELGVIPSAVKKDAESRDAFYAAMAKRGWENYQVRGCEATLTRRKRK
ncbi:MAG: hypothetical protein ABIJ21_06500 [Nanoarchaeota archaeon]